MSNSLFAAVLKNGKRPPTQGVARVRRSWVDGPPQLGHSIRQTFCGRVVSTAMDKTISVEISQYYRHPIVKKYVKTTKKFFAHDEFEECNRGDVVEIVHCRPLSKRKHFVLNRILSNKTPIDWQHTPPTPLTHHATPDITVPATTLPSHNANLRARKDIAAALATREHIKRATLGRK